MEQELLEGGISREGRHICLRTSLGEKLSCVSFGLTQPIMSDSRHCLCPAKNGAHCSIMLIWVLYGTHGRSQEL